MARATCRLACSAALLLSNGVCGGTARAEPPLHGSDGSACAALGDDLRGRRDRDTFTLTGRRGEWVRIEVTAAGEDGGLVMLRAPGRRSAGRAAPGPQVARLPLEREIELAREGDHVISIGQLASAPRGHRPPRGLARMWQRLERLRAEQYAGDYCLHVASSGTAAATLAASGDVEVPWVALAEGADSLPPFVRTREGVADGRIQPTVPLLGSRVYGLILTTGIRGVDGEPLQAAAAFRSRKGTREREGRGPYALFADDPDAAGNPYPEARLVREDGTIRIPDRIAVRGLDPDDPALALARASLREIAFDLRDARGFSTSAPVRILFSAPIDIATLTPENALFYERRDGRLDLEGLLAEAARHGVPENSVALAISFPTQRIEEELLAVRDRLDELEADGYFQVTFEDPDPSDDLTIGVFDRDAPGAFGGYLAANPEIGAVAQGLLPAPDFRGEDGLFDPARVNGAAPFREALLDFRLVVPSGPGPHPVVITQHGFGGSNVSVLFQGPLFARAGLAVVGIDALSHGRRGSPPDLITSTPLQVRDIFRQTNSDQMSLLRAIAAGIDLDEDGVADLQRDGVGYLGISLGGLMGGVLAGVERRLGPAVLNVAGGRVALLARGPGVQIIYQAVLAQRVGLPIASPEFQVYNDRILELGEFSENPADSLNWARRWNRQPLPGSAARRMLLQQGVGDDLVLNVLTEELARVAGYTPNRARRDPNGVSGYWIFEPPGGHGIFSRPDVQEQALTFLESDGTEIIDPTAAVELEGE